MAAASGWLLRLLSPLLSGAADLAALRLCLHALMRTFRRVGSSRHRRPTLREQTRPSRSSWSALLGSGTDSVKAAGPACRMAG